MITSIENKMGIVSFDNALMDQIISDALAQFKGSYKLNKKEYSMETEGLTLDLNLQLKFGTSINIFTNAVINDIVNRILNNLELTIKYVRINIVGIYSKKLVKRNIIVEYDGKSGVIINRN